MSTSAKPADRSSAAERLGLPESGAGSLAPLGRRLGALIIDWAASIIVAIGLFGLDVMRGSGWRQFMTMAVFYVESTLLTAFAGGSFGHLLSRCRVIRLDGRPGPIGPIAALRQLMVCIIIPAIVSGPDGRGLHDTVCGSALVKTR